MPDESAPDQNSAPDQRDDGKPSVTDAHLARGVPGAEPPPEEHAARVGAQKGSSAGLPSIWATARRGLREMGAKRTFRTLRKLNQKDGFDCPSCAWPDPDDERKRFEFCENGAKAVAAEATTARVTPEFFAAHPIAMLTGESDRWLDQQGRITHPMVRRSGAERYEPIAWDDAFRLIADELLALESPDQAAFYTSGRASNDWRDDI